MNSNKIIYRFAGLLIILGMISGILSVVPSVEGMDYLTKASLDKNKLISAAIFQLLLVPIYIGFALLFFPILKRYNESLAIGFVGFRLIASVFQVIGAILLPIFFLLSQEYLKVTSEESSFFEMIGEILKLVRDLANHLGVMLAMGLGNLILFYILIRTKLVPKWLSWWGLIANSIAMITSFLILIGNIEVISIWFAILTLPLVVQELIFAIWLILRGGQKPSIPNTQNNLVNQQEKN